MTKVIRRRVVGAIFFGDIPSTNLTKSKLTNDVLNQLNNTRDYTYLAYVRSSRSDGKAKQLAEGQIAKVSQSASEPASMKKKHNVDDLYEHYRLIYFATAHFRI